MRGQRYRLFREQSARHLCSATLCHRKSAQFRGLSRTLLGHHRERRARAWNVEIHGIERTFFDYAGRGVPYGPDNGTLAPWAVIASLPFAPEIVLPAIDFFIHEIKVKQSNPYGFKASFNPTHPGDVGNFFGYGFRPGTLDLTKVQSC